MGLILNTRPAFYQERFHAAFGELEWAIYDCPVTIPEPIANDMPSPAGFDTLIFTSQVGVATFAATPPWKTKRVLAVGQGTAEAATAAGFADVVQTGNDIEDMRNFIRESAFKSAFYPSADEISGDLEAEFPSRVRRVAIYKMSPRGALPQQLVDILTKGTEIAAPLFSGRGAHILAQLLAHAGVTVDNANIVAVGISDGVFAQPGPWRKQFVAREPLLMALVDKTDEAIRSFAA